MIKTKLINQVKESKIYIALTVIAQWVKLIANIIMMFAVADMIKMISENELITVNHIVKLCLIGLAAAVVRYVCTLCISKTSFLASAGVKKNLRSQMYNKLTRIGASYHQRVSTSEVIQVFTEGVDQLELYFGKYLPQFFYSMLAPLTLFIILSFISFKASVILMICVPLIPMSIVAVQKIAKKLLSKYWGKYVDLGDTFLENIQGLTTLKIYRADEAKNTQMNQKAEEFRRITMKVLTMQLNSITIMDIVAYGGSAAGVIISVSQVMNGQITLSQAFLIIMLAADFFLPLRALGSFFHVAMNGMAASDKLFKLLESDEPEHGTKILTGNKFDIEFSDVTYSYDNEKNALENINLKVPQGGFAAVVGESGCGKSTLASVLAGTAKGYKGSVKVGGEEVAGIKEESLFENITYISFNSYLFTGTVRDNLIMAKPEATDEELISVLRKVKLWDFLSSQNGLDTKILQQASNLSGGQRQRLSLARAILHDTPVYIFDEATSNIDVESEADIMELIREAAGRKTVIVITHRLENAVNADRIFVLDKGHIAESGTHEELMKNGGIYSRMYTSQAELEKYSLSEVTI